MPAALCTILVADDDEFVRADLADFLGSAGNYRLLFAETAKETFETLKKETVDLVLLDIKFPDCQDLSLLRRIRSELSKVEVIILSSQTGSIPQVVEAIQLGAYDYVPKPFAREELLNRVERALNLQRMRREQEVLMRDLEERSGLKCIVGRSTIIDNVRKTVKRLADMDGCVLIEGDSGTGKELAARALHYAGKRQAQPFVIINCASIPETLVESTFFGHKKGSFTGATENAKGKFEVAENGTLFLDEVGDMPLAQQTALLRVLEYRKFTPVGESREKDCRARFVLATNRDLQEEVRRGRFREDLFYRIRVARIEMPSLVARSEDISMLATYYCSRLTAEMGRSSVSLSPEVLNRFQKYDWPGNVRELRNILEGIIMLLDPKQQEIGLADLPADLLSLDGQEMGSDSEINTRDLRAKRDLIRALRQCDGNQTRAAKLMGCHRNTIRSKIRHYGITSLYPETAEDSQS